jgi:glycosyltransferase involved in cell wall biosynthesis
MQSADLFVFASKREGLPVAVMEAMASGLPIVATKVRGNRDLVVEGETGFLVEVGDATTLARRVAQLLANEELRRSFGRRARERIQAYKLEHALEAMDEIYSAVLGET